MCAHNIASDPHFTTKFFHFMIETILRTLFGVERLKYQVKVKMGILSHVSAYFGIVESQNHGSLHLHILIWLEGAPSSEEMHKKLLRSAEFRERVREYIRANIRAYVPGLDSAATIKKIPNETDIAYARPIDPNVTDFDKQLSSFELHLACAKQVHTCELRRCLVPTKKGHYKCKQHALLELSDTDVITEAGQWKPKHFYGYINGYNPGVLLNCRCNNNIKLLTNGKDTHSSSFYITSYSTKKQNRIHNLSAVIAKGYAYHMEHSNYLEDFHDNHCLLLF